MHPGEHYIQSVQAKILWSFNKVELTRVFWKAGAIWDSRANSW